MTDDFTHECEDTGCSEYRALSRRKFVTAAAASSAAAFFPAWLPKVVLSETHASNRDVIVSIFLRGGADGLTLCVPFGDPNYYASRTTIAIPRPDDASTATRGIALDNFFAFPQALGPLMPAYNAKNLLVVHATGQFNNSRSHFEAQRHLEVGKPADPSLVTGWLGRHLASVPPIRSNAPLRALGLSAGLQKTLVGGPRTLPIAAPDAYSIGGSATSLDQRLAILRTDYTSSPQPAQASALDASNTLILLRSVNFNSYVPANGAVYPASEFGRALRSVAVLIKADVGIEAAQVDLGGWDTHSQQNPIGGTMFNSMRDLSTALAAFYADVMQGSSAYGVTVVALSEFGRNVRQNGTAGTDHGRGTAMFVMGKGIAGGRVLVNQWPGLARENLENNQDLKVTIDLRDILAEIVSKRLENTNLGFVFPEWTPTFRGVTV